MKTLFIVYHEDMESKVLGILQRGMVVTRYTRIDKVVGAHMVEMEAQTGYKADRHNHIIMVMGNAQVIKELVKALKVLQKTEGHGLRGFVVDAAEMF